MQLIATTIFNRCAALVTIGASPRVTVKIERYKRWLSAYRTYSVRINIPYVMSLWQARSPTNWWLHCTNATTIACNS